MRNPLSDAGGGANLGGTCKPSPRIRGKLSVATLARFSASAAATLSLLTACGQVQNSFVAGSRVTPAATLLSAPASERYRGALLYIAYGGGGAVMYDYRSWKPRGSLHGFKSANGLCVDKAQNVYVTDYTSEKVFEYAHGAESPEKSFDDSGGSGVACAVDPTTGRLAIANEMGSTQLCGNVEVYRRGSTPTIYTAGAICLPFDAAYDDEGDLFVSGLNGNPGYYAIAELPFHKSSFVNVLVNRTLDYPGGLQWDGKFLDAGNTTGGSTSIIYRFAIRGRRAHLAGTVTLQETNGQVGLYLPAFGTPARRIVVCGQGGYATAEEYRFPAGGAPLRSLSYGIFPSAIAVSNGVK